MLLPFSPHCQYLTNTIGRALFSSLSLYPSLSQVEKTLSSVSWTARAVGAAALASASAALYASNGGWAAVGFAPATALRALALLMPVLNGRAWAGKERVVQAAAQIGADSLGAAMREAGDAADDASHPTRVAATDLMELLLAQSARGAVAYQRICLIAVGTLGSGLRLSLTRAVTAQAQRARAAAAAAAAAAAEDVAVGTTLATFAQRCAAARFDLWALTATTLVARVETCACCLDDAASADAAAASSGAGAGAGGGAKKRDPATARRALEALVALWPSGAISVTKGRESGGDFDAKEACALATTCIAHAVAAPRQVWSVQCAAFELGATLVATPGWAFFIAAGGGDESSVVVSLLVVAGRLAAAARDLKHSKLRTATLALVVAIDNVEGNVTRKAELLKCALEAVDVLKEDPVPTIADKARIVAARLGRSAAKAAQRAAYDAMQVDQSSGGGDI